MNCKKVDLTIESLSEDYKLRLTNVFSVNSLLQNAHAESPAKAVRNLKHLSDVKFEDIGPQEIGLLIGRDNPEVLWVIDQRIEQNKQLFAIKSNLGWFLLGPNSDKGDLARVRTIITMEQESYDPLKMNCDQKLSDLSQLDKRMSKEEKHASEILEKGCCFEECNYIAPLPWKEDNSTLLIHDDEDEVSMKETVSLKSTSETVTHQPKEVDTANLASLVDIDKDEFTLVETVSLVTTSETGNKQPKDLDLVNPSLIDNDDDEDDASSIKDEVVETEICESSPTTLQQELGTRKYEDRKLLYSLALVDKDRLSQSAIKPYNINVCRQKILPRLRIDM